MHLERTGQQAGETFVREISRSSFPVMSKSPWGAGGGNRGIDRGSNPTALCYPLGSRGCLCRFLLDGNSAMAIGISLVYLSEVLRSKES
jgi:hypothetical protein